MGVEDTTKTDTRTDTTDKPASSERPYSPPPDNPGSPGQPSRLESLARAREQQQSRSQETQDRETSPKPAEERDDKATSERTGSGNEKTEASGKPEAQGLDQREDDDRPGTGKPGRPDKREQEPRTQDEGTTGSREPGTGTPADRDRPQGQAGEQRADTATGPADRPASSERRWTPPPDNPGSPGQPSRLESLARAREQQQAAAAQRDQAGDGRSEPSGERGTGPATAQSDNDGANAEPAGKLEGSAQEQDANRPGTDEGRTEDRPRRVASEAPPTPDQNTSEADKPTDGGSEPRTEPAGQTTDQLNGPQAPRPGTTTGELGPQEHATDPPPATEQGPRTSDGPVDDGNQTRPEAAEQPTAPADGTEQPDPIDTQTRPGDEPTGQNAEATEPAPDTGSHTDEPGDQPATDNAPSSPEGPDQDSGTREPHGEQDRDRDKKSEDTDNEPSPNETNEADRKGKTNPILLDARSDSRGRVNFEPRYRPENAADTELSPERPNTAGAENQPTRGDLDPIDPDKLRDDTGDPLETPEEQDLNAPGRDRWERAERAKAGVDAARKLAGKAKDFLKQPPPTGQAEVRDSSSKGPVNDQPTNPADFVSNSIILGVVVIGGTRQMYMKIKNSRR
ncbi:hypothetical protein [Actinomadura sp. 7K507]|uniref:hypothetical protein n=1 Tax=Actinomadura sp. 7K507 TaxID=2530365 RepID=UPI001053C112|nr:hypothetical protein [Actinomadura sp. 7K507]TDC75080.1 hypothetical protein E1285_42020 [Actinomadura sp. 7K507]